MGTGGGWKGVPVVGGEKPEWPKIKQLPLYCGIKKEISLTSECTVVGNNIISPPSSLFLVGRVMGLVIRLAHRTLCDDGMMVWVNGTERPP